jgi:hypothetical protein
MSVSLFVIGVIVVTVGSSMTLMLRAAANNRNPLVSGATSGASTSAQAAVARGATDMLVADLKVATGVTTTSSGGGLTATLIVPGRYGSDTTETIVYSWTGPGASLMRKLNSSTAVSIADNVQSFSLPTLTRTVGTGSASAPTGTTSFSSSPGGSSTSTLSLSSTSYAAEYIPPPASGGTSWSITSVTVTMLGTSSQNVYAEIRSADAGNIPMGSAIGAGASIAGSSVPSKTATPMTFTFPSPISGLSPSQGYMVVVYASATGTKVQYNTSGTAAGMSWTTSTDGGVTWATQVSTSGMVVTVNGTVTQ